MCLVHRRNLFGAGSVRRRRSVSTKFRECIHMYVLGVYINEQCEVDSEGF